MQSAEDFLRALDPVVRGRMISVLRSARGITRDELAKDAKVSPNTISDWEKGHVKNPRDLFAKLEPVLDLSPSNLKLAWTLVRAQLRAEEIGEAPAGLYEGMASGDAPLALLDVQAMGASEIERELSELAAQFGRTVVRCIVLTGELAMRSVPRSTG